MNRKVFAIIGKLEREPDMYIILGTGFFIDEKGFFVTAGHVFRDNRKAISQFYICFPEDNELVDLIKVTDYRFLSRKIYDDNDRNFDVPRNRHKHQCGPEYFDVGVGKVDIGTTDFYAFKIKRPYAWEKLTMPCFNRNKKECKEKKFLLDTGKMDSRYIEFHEHKHKLKERLRLARIPYLYDGMEFKNIDIYNNCIEVYGEGEKGNSGAPVLKEDERVVGIYVAGADFKELRAVLLARYVRKKANVLKKRIIKQR